MEGYRLIIIKCKINHLWPLPLKSLIPSHKYRHTSILQSLAIRLQPINWNKLHNKYILSNQNIKVVGFREFIPIILRKRNSTNHIKQFSQKNLSSNTFLTFVTAPNHKNHQQNNQQVIQLLKGWTWLLVFNLLKKLFSKGIRWRTRNNNGQTLQ